MVCRGEPFQSTCAPTTKLEPFTASVNAPEDCVALFGEREAIEGTGMGSLGPTTVFGLPVAMESETEASPDRVMGVVDKQVSVVVLQVFGLLFEVANKTTLSPAVRFEVVIVKVREVGGRGTPATACGCDTTVVTIASKQVS